MKKQNVATFASTFVRNRSCYSAALTRLLYLLLLVSPSMLYSQNLEDFKKAAASDGVNLIPYTDLRQEATPVADDVQRRKDESKSFDYGVFESQKNNVLKDIRKENQEIEKIRTEMEDLKKKISGIDVSSLEGDIKKKETTIAEYNGKIKEMNEKMAKAVDAFDRLYQARAGLREYFQQTLTRLSASRSNPGTHIGDSPSDDDKKKLEEYIGIIEDQIESRVKDHQDQENGAKKTKEDYENLIKRTEPV